MYSKPWGSSPRTVVGSEEGLDDTGSIGTNVLLLWLRLVAFLSFSFFLTFLLFLEGCIDSLMFPLERVFMSVFTELDEDKASLRLFEGFTNPNSASSSEMTTLGCFLGGFLVFFFLKQNYKIFIKNLKAYRRSSQDIAIGARNSGLESQSG